MVPEPSEMSRTSGVRGILDISDGSGKGQPRAVKVASAGFAPRPFKPAKVSVRGRNMHEKQIRQLERTVSGYFDYIEDLIEREHTFTMEQFAQSVNEFLSFRRYDILEGPGTVSSAAAKEKARREYDIYNKTQKIDSDFDKAVRKMIEENK